MKRSRLGPGARSLERGSTFASRGLGLARTTRLKRGTPKPRVSTPPAVWLEVRRRDGGLCVWSRFLGDRVRAEHPHHLLPKGSGGWPQFFDVRANIVGLSADRHMTHEHSPCDRLPWDALPAECQAFLRGVAVVDPRAERLIVTKYPGSGAARLEGPDGPRMGRAVEHKER